MDQNSNNQPKRYGYYSSKAAEMFGVVTYTKPDGSLVEVTCVGNSPIVPDYYMFDDAICVGEVVKYYSTKKSNLYK